MHFLLFSLKRQISIFERLPKAVSHVWQRFQSYESLGQLDFIPSANRKINCDIYILTKDGQLKSHYGPFDRAEICQEFLLDPRDLQKIDTDLLVNVPIIDVRQNKFICFSFRRLRSLVQSTRSIFFVPSAQKVMAEPVGLKDSVHWERIAQDYQRNVHFIQDAYNQRFIQNRSFHHLNSIPFEFCITELSLEVIASRLKTKSSELLHQFQNVRERGYARITIESLRELALLKEKIDKYKRNAHLAHQAIVDVLADDEDLIGMYLTDNRPRQISDHIQAELLLEASAKEMAEGRRAMTDLLDSVHTLENATGFMLDAVRNELLAFEIRINIVTMGFGLGALIAGIYGMNLNHGFEQSPYAFYAIAGTSVVLIGGTIVTAFFRLLRYRKVRLHRSGRVDVFK